jgi:hypothetical protein
LALVFNFREGHSVSVRLIPLMLSIAFAGCGATARQAPVAAPFTGTWHQSSAASTTEPQGFLAIDSSRLVFNLDGLPRGTVAISGNETDAGLRSGRLECADGRVLYVAVGDSLTTRDSTEGRLLTQTLHLDVHVFAPGAGPGDQPLKILRLWPSAALAVAALPLAPAPVPAITKAITVPTGSPADQRLKAAFAQVEEPFLIVVADHLTEARFAGQSSAAIDAFYRRSTQALRGNVLRDLEAARAGDRGSLMHADGGIESLAEADRAYEDWRSNP